MSKNSNTRHNSRELRDREIQRQTQGYVSRFEPPLSVFAFTQKDFRYVHQGPSTKGPPSMNYNLQIGSTQLQLFHTSTQEGRHKVKNKVKRKITTWWSLRAQTI